MLSKFKFVKFSCLGDSLSSGYNKRGVFRVKVSVIVTQFHEVADIFPL